MIYASLCGGCVCYRCAHSVEIPRQYFTPGECTEPCFSCDECRCYDGDRRKWSQRREECAGFIEARKYTEAKAQVARASFKVIKGGDGHV